MPADVGGALVAAALVGFFLAMTRIVGFVRFFGEPIYRRDRPVLFFVLQLPLLLAFAGLIAIAAVNARNELFIPFLRTHHG